MFSYPSAVISSLAVQLVIQSVSVIHIHLTPVLNCYPNPYMTHIQSHPTCMYNDLCDMQTFCIMVYIYNAMCFHYALCQLYCL